MITRIFTGSFLGLACSLAFAAGPINNINQPATYPQFYVGAYGGYGVVDGAYHEDGNVAQARLTLGTRVKEYNSLLLGAELGVQSGNTMRLDASQSLIDAAGGLPIQATLKPLIDALVTIQYQFNTSLPLFLNLKGGIAYRQLLLNDRNSPEDSLNKVNGEFQAGLGIGITKNVRITALYQGIYSGNNAGVSLSTDHDVMISKIPTQQAGFLGVEYSF
jgi:hypothetical protein